MLDTIVIGAGHAGLAASYYLKKAGVSHVIYERGRIAESWRSQRWDSFYLNTPNWCSHLPGDDYAGDDRDAFYHRDEFVASMERYATRFDLPVETQVEVTRVKPDTNGFSVTIGRGSGAVETVSAKNVIVASGVQNVPRISAIASDLPDWISQAHSADYLGPDQLPEGAVLVVGGGQSGFQIAEDLLEAGRTVYMSSSKVGRLPRRYRGRDIIKWMVDAGIMAQRTEDLEDRSVMYQTIPHVSGVGLRGRTVSYQYLARCGATILGRLIGYTGKKFAFSGDAADNVRFADERSAEIRNAIDGFLIRSGLEFPPHEDDPRDEPDPQARCASGLRELDPIDARISAVIWCTGFKGVFDWIDAPILDDDGRPRHADGVSEIPGLYFLGFPWLRSRKSGIIPGVGEDAAFIVSRMAER